MVVSRQKIIIVFVLSFLVFLIPQISSASVRELTDQEMDSIMASGLNDDIIKLVSDVLLENDAVTNPLSLLGSSFGETLSGANGFVNINAVSSEIFVQSNFTVVIGSLGGNIYQSNVYESP